MKHLNTNALKSRLTLKRENKSLIKENEELKRNINSKYWSSANVILDHLFHTDVTLYNKVHSIVFGKTFGKIESPTHEQIEQWKKTREKELLNKISELEKQNENSKY